MATLVRFILSFLLLGTAAAPLPVSDFHLHDFDAGIAKALGYENPSIVYMSEMASVSQDEAEMRRKYEEIGCYPFYVIKEGEVQEAGYNCGTFFCTGYFEGPKQCRDRGGASYGGVVEINRRLGLTHVQDETKFFDAFPGTDVTSAMRQRMDELKESRCRPFYLQRFDLVVGEGYTCDEIGRYPYFSGANTCVNDWRKQDGMQCALTDRPDELEFRKEILARLSGKASSASSSSRTVAAAAPAQAQPPLRARAFPDVVAGKYGYTAIMALTEAGILRGYPDGTFQPQRAINRAEFTSLLLRRYAQDAPEGGNCFRDVQDQWYAPAVCAAKELGWVIGYEDGRFRPNAPIKRAEALKIVTSSLYLSPVSTGELPPDVPADAWYATNVRMAKAHGLILEPIFLPSIDATRADVAVWLYRAMKVLPTGSGGTL